MPGPGISGLYIDQPIHLNAGFAAPLLVVSRGLFFAVGKNPLLKRVPVGSLKASGSSQTQSLGTHIASKE